MAGANYTLFGPLSFPSYILLMAGLLCSTGVLVCGFKNMSTGHPFLSIDETLRCHCFSITHVPECPVGGDGPCMDNPFQHWQSRRVLPSPDELYSMGGCPVVACAVQSLQWMNVPMIKAALAMKRSRASLYSGFMTILQRRAVERHEASVFGSADHGKVSYLLL